MPRPFLIRRRRRSLLRFVAEFALISLAVFVGLLADEWREGRAEARLARDALERFRAEVVSNEELVKDRRPYHEMMRDDVSGFVSSPGAKTLQTFGEQVAFRGVRPLHFEQTAWQLALATQGLSYIPAEIVYPISRVYLAQAALEKQQDSFAQSAAAPSTFATGDLTGLAFAMQIYFSDVVLQELRLVTLYTELRAALDEELGPAPDAAPGAAAGAEPGAPADAESGAGAE